MTILYKRGHVEYHGSLNANVLKEYNSTWKLSSGLKTGTELAANNLRSHEAISITPVQTDHFFGIGALSI